SGSLLQLSLVLGVAFTIVIFDGRRPIATSTLLACAIWLPMILIWKFLLAIVPENATEFSLKAIIPVSHFFFILFWPVLYPMRRYAARVEAEAEEENADEEPTDE